MYFQPAFSFSTRHLTIFCLEKWKPATFSLGNNPIYIYIYIYNPSSGQQLDVFWLYSAVFFLGFPQTGLGFPPVRWSILTSTSSTSERKAPRATIQKSSGPLQMARRRRNVWSGPNHGVKWADVSWSGMWKWPGITHTHMYSIYIYILLYYIYCYIYIYIYVLLIIIIIYIYILYYILLLYIIIFYYHYYYYY